MNELEKDAYPENVCLNMFNISNSLYKSDYYKDGFILPSIFKLKCILIAVWFDFSKVFHEMWFIWYVFAPCK